MGGTLTLCPPYEVDSASFTSTIFRCHPRQSNPTGKSLLIFRNGVKPGNRKYFRCRVGQITDLNQPVYRDKRGDRDRHDRAVGCDGREVATDERGVAYGEVVRVRRPGAGVNS